MEKSASSFLLACSYCTQANRAAYRIIISTSYILFNVHLIWLLLSSLTANLGRPNKCSCHLQSKPSIYAWFHGIGEVVKVGFPAGPLNPDCGLFGGAPASLKLPTWYFKAAVSRFNGYQGNDSISPWCKGSSVIKNGSVSVTNTGTPKKYQYNLAKILLSLVR